MKLKKTGLMAGLILTLLSVTACAPAIHESTYYGKSGTTYVNVQAPQRQAQPIQMYRSIQVTLYTDKAYRGSYFQPVQLVIADGQYVEIPIKNRRGRMARIYAHYQANDLHFDSSRRCQRIPGSTSYKYLKTWDNGHKYGHVNAGNDYDLSGLHLSVRNLTTDRQHANREVVERVDFKSRHKNTKIVNNNSKTVTYNTNNSIDINNKKDVKKTQFSKAVHKPTVVKKIEKTKDTRRATVVKNDVRIDDIMTSKRHKGYREVLNENSNVKSHVVRKTRNGPGNDINQSVRVSFISGLINVGGKQGVLKRSSLTLKNGESRNITLVAANGNKVVVPVSYRNGTLKVSRQGNTFKRDSSWVKGKAYNLSTRGNARIENVQFTVATL